MSTPPEPTIHTCQCPMCQAGSDPQIVRQHYQMNVLLSRLTEPQRRWYVGFLSQQPLEAVILTLVAPHTAGDPMSDQKWLNCRLSDLRQRLDGQGHRVSKPVISRILRAHGYSLRANVKQAAGADHPERDQQFQHI